MLETLVSLQLQTRRGYKMVHKQIYLHEISLRRNQAAYVAHEAGRPKPSKSILRCNETINNVGCDAIESECRNFLTECKPLHVALKAFSDMMGQPMAAHVAQTLELLFEHASPRDAPPGFLEALKHHKRQLEKNHNMKFWKEVMWFRPSWIVQCARPSNTPSISGNAPKISFPDPFTVQKMVTSLQFFALQRSGRNV